ncbi:MAG: NHL repeat protein [Mesotoga infera]|jgi:DNA-binding beta-propeller fold protein YncE|uniref:NHL repeat protein n=1 Tax=Mesotoga infera TaxID=1236046 RepID=A0A101I6X3_9BACT|nr:MAG: NHL repeat protein [Mesotoga infera]
MREAIKKLEGVNRLKNLVLLAVWLFVALSLFGVSAIHEASWGVQGATDGQLSDPHGLASDNKGMIYVADTLNHRIQIFDSNGKHKASFGNYGSANGEFLFPHDVVVDSEGYIYVADSQNGRVQKFDNRNEFVKAWGTKGPEPGQFDGPMFMAIDGSDKIYIGDTFNQRIQVFDNEGILLMTMGAKVNMFDAMNPGNLASISGLSVDSNGNVYISDDVMRRIQKFDSQGVYIPDWASSFSGNWGQPGESVVDRFGNLIYINKTTSMIIVLDPGGNFLFEWGGSGTTVGFFSRPIDISLGSYGHVFVLEQSGNRIQRFRIAN